MPPNGPLELEYVPLLQYLPEEVNSNNPDSPQIVRRRAAGAASVRRIPTRLVPEQNAVEEARHEAVNGAEGRRKNQNLAQLTSIRYQDLNTYNRTTDYEQPTLMGTRHLPTTGNHDHAFAFVTYVHIWFVFATY